jgi:hypothetical protein
MKNTFLLFHVLWLTGCASLSYQEPTEGSRARVRFVSTSESITILRVYDDASCTRNESEWMRLRAGTLINSTPKRLGMPLWNYHKNAAKEVYVAAKKSIHGMFFGGKNIQSTVYSCGVPFSFTFSENVDYEIAYQWRPRLCSVSIAEIVRMNDSWSLKEVGKFDSLANDLNRGCLKRYKEL